MVYTKWSHWRWIREHKRASTYMRDGHAVGQGVLWPAHRKCKRKYMLYMRSMDLPTDFDQLRRRNKINDAWSYLQKIAFRIAHGLHTIQCDRALFSSSFSYFSVFFLFYFRVRESYKSTIATECAMKKDHLSGCF